MNRSLLLVLVWTAIAAGLRFWNLDGKPPWTDEFATLVFSLGQSYDAIPVGQLLTTDTLLQILRPLSEADPQGVIDRVLEYDNHPPVYFALAHLWYRLFPDADGYLSVTVARSLPAIFGTLAVPLGYGCAKGLWGAKSDRIAQWVALAIAVSPYGIFLSQEARHYTLAILWGLLSLTCCLKSARYWQRGQRLPLSLNLGWIAVNAIGLSTHFLLTLLLVAEAIALVLWRWQQWRQGKTSLWQGLYIYVPVTLGTLAALGVWVWLIQQRDYGNGMTQWIQFDEMNWFGFLFGPPVQLLAAWITMICLLPVESSQLGVVILSGLAMLVYFVWLIPVLKRGIQTSLHSDSGLETALLIRIFIALAGVYLAIAYGAGFDITRGARYSFNFWPVMMLLVGVGLAESHHQTHRHLPPNLEAPNGFAAKLNASRQGLFLPAIFLLVGILSGLTITYNLGYQKYYRPDRFLTLLTQTPTTETRWIVSPHQSLVQTGELMGVALETQRHFPDLAPQLRFLLLPATHSRDPAVIEQLNQHLAAQSTPIDLWVVNYLAPINLSHCQKDQAPAANINGYPYQHFACLPPDKTQK